MIQMLERETPQRRRDLVVCVDDEPAVLASLRRLFRQERFEVVTTEDPQQALELVRRHRVGLLITDQLMPGIVGTELLKAVRARSPETASVVLTAYADRSDVAAALQQGSADRLVRKPWDDEEFSRLVRTLLAAGSGSAPPAPPEPGTETVVSVECRQRPVGDVIAEIEDLLRKPSGRLVFILRHLRELRGSMTRFLGRLTRTLARPGLRAAIVDESGAAGDYLGLLDDTVPVVAFSRRTEAGRSRRILVVESDPQSREFLQRTLEAAGHSCRAIPAVLEAIRTAEARRFDLMVLGPSYGASQESLSRVLQKNLRLPVLSTAGPQGLPSLSSPRGISDLLKRIRALP